MEDLIEGFKSINPLTRHMGVTSLDWSLKHMVTPVWLEHKIWMSIYEWPNN